MLDTQLPTAQDVENSCAVLRGEAAKLAVFTLGTGEPARDRVPGGGPHWEAPGGGPPAPGAAEAAQGYLKVAETLEGLTEPLRAFEAHMSQGGTPYEFLMMMISEGMNAGA